MSDAKKLTPEVLAFLDKCSEAVGNYEADNFNVDLWDFCAYGEVSSPIEHFFHSALRTLIRMNFLDIEEIDTPKSNGPQIVGVTIKSQAEIENYRVDFLVTSNNYRGNGILDVKTVIVECDSQTFHERTEPERRYEKKRDRFLIKKGYEVFHFTGTEIMREPFRVASEVLSHLTGQPADELINTNFITE